MLRNIRGGELTDQVPVGTESKWEELDWSGLVWSGLVWPGLVWSGLVWSGRSWRLDKRSNADVRVRLIDEHGAVLSIHPS